MDAPPFALPSRYTYDNKTLAGGQGAVYVCNDANLERKVAVKALHTVSNVASLLKEITARSKIKSKHVVEIYELLLTTDGKPFAIVLEFVPGNSLEDKSALPTDLSGRLLLLYQLANGLHEIHSAGVIHRDIKPQNMMVDGAGVLKILDLGISNVDADSASTVGAAGTLVYRAPELYVTAPIPVTKAADIYAFGVTVWHVFGATFPSQLLEVPPQISGTSPSIATIAPELGDLAHLFDQTLSVDPQERPKAKELCHAIARRLLHARQRGVFAYGEKIWELMTAGTATVLKSGKLGILKVGYDGDDFVVQEVSGDVYINNVPAAVNDKLPPSCVVTFGEPSLGAGRLFLPFNVSQPEIVM